KIFINIVLIFFWCNPFFWFIRKELNIIHEFIADKKALEDSDTAAFAVMILQATYPQQRFIITNNFFYSPLKRRLAMLTKNKNPRINYVSWLLALPLAALIFFAFTFKVKKINHVFPKKSEAPDLTKESGIISQNLGIIKSPELIIDTIPDMRYNNKKVTNLKVIPSDVKIKVTYDDGTNEYITMVEAKKRGFVLPPPPPPTMPLTSSVDLTYVLNGKIISKAEFNSVSPDNIQSINVIKGNNAFIKYGNDGKNGVIEVITKNEKARSYDKRESVTADSTNFNGIENNVLIKGNKTDTIYWNNDKVFTKVEVEPSFPGGDMAWARYIKKTIEGNINELSSENKSGTCRVRFIVDIDGSVRDVKVLSMEGTKLAEVTMNAIKKGPKWIPAKQKDQVVAAYREQPVTFTIQDVK
ncbi:MAG: energy transducer TonB, partial [Chitinophagaceae bacterium]